MFVCPPQAAALLLFVLLHYRKWNRLIASGKDPACKWEQATDYILSPDAAEALYF